MKTILEVGFTAILCSFIIYPLDIAHTILAMDCTPHGNQRKLITIWDYFKTIPKNNKMRALYKGLSTQLASSMLYITTLAMGIQVWEKGVKNKTKITAFVALGLTALIAETISYPMDTIKRCLQVDKKTTFIELLSSSFKGKNTFILMRGLPAHLIRVLIMMITTGTMYTLLKPKLS